MSSAAPPYALTLPPFPFRALAALAGRAPLGGEREVALGCVMAARLAAALLPPDPLPADARRERALHARVWFASLALPAAMRIPFARVVEATAGDSREAAGAALAAAGDTAAPFLDFAAAAELRHLAERLGAASGGTEGRRDEGTTTWRDGGTAADLRA